MDTCFYMFALILLLSFVQLALLRFANRLAPLRFGHFFLILVLLLCDSSVPRKPSALSIRTSPYVECTLSSIDNLCSALFSLVFFPCDLLFGMLFLILIFRSSKVGVIMKECLFYYSTKKVNSFCTHFKV